jgi:type I restriction enzyme S subunit
LLQEYKKGVMQKIFNQEVRFKDDDRSEFCEWERTELNEFLVERITYPKDLLPIYSLTIQDGIIPKSDRYERAFLVKEDYEYKAMVKDDFAFNPMNLRFGALARHKEEISVMVSKYYNIFYCNEKLNPYFAELYFTNYNSIQYYNKMATGSLEEKKRVHFKEFLKFKFFFPCLKEQIKISNFLSSIDKKIKNTKNELEKTKEFKKALLQQMFV